MGHTWAHLNTVERVSGPQGTYGLVKTFKDAFRDFRDFKDWEYIKFRQSADRVVGEISLVFLSTLSMKA